MFKIKVSKNGPYLVSNLEKLSQEAYMPDNNGVLNPVELQQFPVEKEMALCRCGHSKQAPFCDGSHEKVNFDGTETADHSAYLDRSETFTGPKLSLLDDERCAFSRFCHREQGEVWTLTTQSDDPEKAKEAIQGASLCPSGRLTAVLDGELVEDEYQDTLAIAEDLQERVSASLNARGDFTLESADGTLYEKRNRLALCRCGQSRNKPFCDASHVNAGYQDGIALPKEIKDEMKEE